MSKEYRFSIRRTFQVIPIFITIIFLLCIIEIFSLEYSIGFVCISESLGNIIQKLCYSFVSSYIFYFLMQAISIAKNRHFNTQILERKMNLLLDIQYYQLCRILAGVRYIGGPKSYLLKITPEAFIYRMNNKNTWAFNIQRLQTISKKIDETIYEILTIQLDLNIELKNTLDIIVTNLRQIPFDAFYDPEVNEEIDEKKIFIDMSVPNFQLVIDQFNLLIKKFEKKT